MKPKEIADADQTILKEIGARLKELRTEKGLSYTKLAEEIGINRNTYNLMENGKVYFTISKLLLILRYHNVSLSEFFRDL
ncbi:MAG: helix-turn-helix domain-containing protein [bacterium]